jgi:hypothetical protein
MSNFLSGRKMPSTPPGGSYMKIRSIKTRLKTQPRIRSEVSAWLNAKYANRQKVAPRQSL